MKSDMPQYMQVFKKLREMGLPVSVDQLSEIAKYVEQNFYTKYDMKDAFGEGVITGWSDNDADGGDKEFEKYINEYKHESH